MTSWLQRAIGISVVGGAIAAACSFSPVGATSDAPMVDAAIPPPDGSLCAGASVECADPNTLRTCTTSGSNYVDTTCSWGCASARCGVLLPAGGGIGSGDVNATGLVGPINLSGNVNGDDGSITGGTTRAAGSGVKSDIDYEIRGNVAMFRFQNLHITGTVALKGGRPIVFVADQAITVDAAIDGMTQCTTTAAGPGGFTGATTKGGNGNGTGGGTGGTTTGGGGGGGYGGIGGPGGGTTGGAGGVMNGDMSLATLIGGAGGGGGQSGNAGLGGGGGAALQLVSNTSITISATGVINAGGCGGNGGVSGAGDAGGGGGGAGGALLLEAPSITINGVVAVNGGGGGGGRNSGGGNGTRGSNGTANRTAASPGGGDMAGGPGAAGASFNGTVGATKNSVGGGGGGAIGWIRINTRSGTATVDNTKLSPALDDPSSTCSQGAAVVQ